MKNIKKILVLIVLVYCVSCNFMEGELKRLDEKTIMDEKIQVNWYKVSSLTWLHEHIEVTQNGKTKEIAKLNAGSIESILINEDSIIIEIKGKGLFYNLEKKSVWL